MIEFSVASGNVIFVMLLGAKKKQKRSGIGALHHAYPGIRSASHEF